MAAIKSVSRWRIVSVTPPLKAEHTLTAKS
jgi:hypothetical protein